MNLESSTKTVSGTVKRNKAAAILKLILLIAILAGASAFIYLRYGDVLFGNNAANNIISYIHEHSDTAAWVIIGLQTLQIIFSILPGQPIQFAASYVFGVFKGFLLSITGAVIGVTIVFFLSRILGRDAVYVIFGEEKTAYYQERLNSARGLMIVFILYFIPGLPKDIVAYAAGVSEIRFIPFLIVSSIGRCPGMLGSLLLGYFVNTKNYIAIVILGLVAGITLLICFLRRKQMLTFIDGIDSKEKDIENRENQQ